MHRAAVREFLAPGTSVSPGEVVVPTQIGDPVRGLLPSPAAPLLAGTLRRKGRRVRLAAVPRCEDPSADGDGAAVFVATCRQRDGAAAAIGAAAAVTDRVAVAAARSAVQEWSAAFATRRLLSAASPWCSGAERALATARRAVAGRAGVYVYGELAASPEEVAELAGQGAVFASALADVPDGATVVFPAHGVPAGVRAEAAARGMEVIDATCQLVARVHAEARRFADRGDDLVLVGQPGHAVLAGIAGQAPDRTVVAASAAGTAALRVADSRRVSYLLAPGIPVEDAAGVVAALRSRFPGLRGPNPDGFCYAASDRAQTVRAVAAGSDLVLVLGAADSADSRNLAAMARSCGPRVQVLGQAGDLTPDLLAGVTAIGLVQSTSASPGLAGQVTQALAGLGPLSVASRRVTTDLVGAPQQRG